MSKIKKLIFSILLLLFVYFIFFNTISQAALFGGTPEIVDKLNSAFEKIEEWLTKLATPAAAVAVGDGVLMEKCSFGDEE